MTTVPTSSLALLAEGDDWIFTVLFADATGAPIVIPSDTLPALRVTVGTDRYDLTEANGGLVTVDRATGTATGVLARTVTDTITPEWLIWQPSNPYPVRLRAMLTDSLNHRTTYRTWGVATYDPATVDLTQLPTSTTLIAVTGPAGPRGPAGASDSSIDAIIFG